MSIQWGAWAEGGMAASNAAIAIAVQRLGMGMISPAQGMAAFQLFMLMHSATSFPGVIVAVPFRWEKFIRQLDTSAIPFVLHGVATPTCSEHEHETAMLGHTCGHPDISNGRAPSASRQTSGTPFFNHTESSTTKEKTKHITEQLFSLVTIMIGTTIDLQQPLMEAGLDSLGK